MTLTFEVLSRFQEAGDADRLLYTPIKQNLTFQRTRFYKAEVNGDVEKARTYLLSVLVDPIAQTVSESGTPILTGDLFHVDYFMKPGALDLEKQAILENYRGRKDLGFSLESLTITQRVYIFGQGDTTALSSRFIKDICNPAIHRWTVSCS